MKQSMITALLAALVVSLSPLAAAAQGRDRPEAYIVRPGDTLRSVARALDVPLEDLLRTNPGISERDLVPGRTLELGRFRRPPEVGSGPRRPSPRLTVEVDAREAEPGGTATVRVSGLPPRAAVSVEAEPANGRGGGTDGDAQANRNGTALVEIDIPRRARPGERWTLDVTDDRDRTIGGATFRIADAAVADEPLRLIGILTDEDDECPTLRARSGAVYALAGRLRGFRAGDRVVVTGRPVERSSCAADTTVTVDRIDAAR